MNIKTHHCLKTLSLALSLELAMSTSLPAVATEYTLGQQPLVSAKEVLIAQRRRARLRFRVPNLRASGNLRGGAARGNCSVDGISKVEVVPLVPTTNIGLTVAAKPTFFFQVSKSAAKEAKFSLLNKEGDDTLYEKTFPLTSTGGVMSFTLPADAQTLEVNKEYRWSLEVICDTQDGDQGGNTHVEGAVKRVTPEAPIAQELNNAPISDRLTIYTQAGYWYDTVKTLAQLRLDNPNDSTLKEEWTDLLDEVGLNTIAQQPLVQCCTLENQ